jgi:hypothetical protein
MESRDPFLRVVELKGKEEKRKSFFYFSFAHAAENFRRFLKFLFQFGRLKFEGIKQA